jgi:uncharacterized circularly permuted ATP-grasp superfamily protein
LPWTRQVAEGKTDFQGETVDLIPHIAAHRAELVLKPADAYGGSGVFVGSETDDATWENALRAALASDARWVVQRRVATPTEPYPIRVGDGFEFRPMKFNVNPFYLGDRMCGAVTRTSTDAVINVSAGGGSIPTFVVAAREAA